IYGWGRAPWGRHRWGRARALRVAGWGCLPWGRSPWGLGAVVIDAEHSVDYCGAYIYAFACYDLAGNLHEGSPAEVPFDIHIPPPVPAGLKKNAYDKETDVLTLDVA
ncbi:hypothetical protein LCGC14_2543620, partial [marine sediment metagenome]